MKENKTKSILWIFGTILEWINIILFMAAMGYDFIDFSLYNELRDFRYINAIFYTLGGIDAFIFWILVRMNKKSKNVKEMALAVYCCLIQLILIIYKVKL